MRVLRGLLYLSSAVALGIPLADWTGVLETTFNPIQVVASCLCLLSSGALLMIAWRSKASDGRPSKSAMVAIWSLFLGSVAWLGLIFYHLATMELMGH